MKRLSLLCGFLLPLAFGASAQKAELRVITEAPPEISPEYKVKQEWKFMNGDDPSWAFPAFNDSSWDTVNTKLPYPAKNFEGLGWFRLHISFDSTIVASPVAIALQQTGACEIYFDGKKLKSFGKVAKNKETEERYYPQNLPVALNASPGEHIIALRYSNHDPEHSYDMLGKNVLGFYMDFVRTNEVLPNHIQRAEAMGMLCFLMASFFFTLGLVHLLIFCFYRSQRAYLYYFFYNVMFALYPLAGFTLFVSNDFYEITIWKIVLVAAMPFLFNLLLMLLYSFFYPKMPKYTWYMLCVSALTTFLIVSEVPHAGWILILIVFGSSVEALRIIIAAVVKKKKGARIIGVGVLFFAGFIITIGVVALVSLTSELNFSPGSAAGSFITVFFCLSLVSIPLSMSVYLAKDFADTNKEKQKILETQKEVLEQQVKERTIEVVEQKHIIEEKNKDITDSINYAKRIQDAFLPAKELKYRLFPDAFVLFQPRDIVSGDFYWFTEKNGTRLIAAVDCTGHGVPGAFMSMIGNAYLNEVVNEKDITEPGKILGELRNRVIQSLKQTGSEGQSKDGMDIALLSFNEANSNVRFSGANNPLWKCSQEYGKWEISEYEANKRPIGYYLGQNIPFESHDVPVKKGDTLYIFTDGFADQFGGAKGKKFKYKQMKELLLSIQHRSMQEQETILSQTFNAWKGHLEQVDDVLMIGIRI